MSQRRAASGSWGSCSVAGLQDQSPNAPGDFSGHAGFAEAGTSQVGAPFLVVGAGCYVHSVMKPDCCFDLVRLSGKEHGWYRGELDNPRCALRCGRHGWIRRMLRQGG